MDKFDIKTRIEQSGIDIPDEEFVKLRTIGNGCVVPLRNKTFNPTLRAKLVTYLSLFFADSKFHFKEFENQLFIWRLK